MKPILLKTILSFFIFCYINSNAQTVSGKWYGAGFPDVLQSANNYMCEFILIQKGQTVTGEFNYFFRNGYFSNKVKGNYNASSRLLTIDFLPIMYFKTENTLIGVDCPMKGQFILKIANIETTLSGEFISDALHAYTCAPVKMKLVKQPDNAPTLKQIVQKELQFDTTATIKTEEETPQQKIEKEAERQLKMRVKNLIKILDVSDDSVRVDLYDNAEFDYDTVSIFYNDKLTQYKQLLNTKTPISFYAHVDSIETNNDLVMFAENLGLIPPNAAIMIITDKKHRYEVSLTSNYRSNAAVRLRKLQSPQMRTAQ